MKLQSGSQGSASTRTQRLCVALALTLVWMVTILPTVSAERVVIEHLMSASWGQAALDATKQIAEIFNNSQNEITVQVTTAAGNYEDLVLTRLAGGAAPDVINSNRFGDLAPKGILHPLTAFAKRDGLISKLIPPGVEFTTWDNEMLMLPQVVQPFVTYYNTNLFNERGIQDPYSTFKAGNWNWAAVSSAAKKITADKDGDGKFDYRGMGIPVNWIGRAVTWVNQAGGKYFDTWTNPRKATFNSPGVIQALEFLHDQVYETQGMPLDVAIGSSGNTHFGKGTLGMVFEGPWQIGSFRLAKFYDWDVVPLPKGPVNAGSAIQVDGIQMMKATKHPEEAWKWMRFLTFDPQAYTIFTTLTGRPSGVLRGLQTYLDSAQSDGKPVHIDAFANAMNNSYLAPCTPAVVNISAIGASFNTEVTKYLQNKESVTAALTIVDDYTNQVLAEANKK